MKKLRLAALVVLTALGSACGGGGESGEPEASPRFETRTLEVGLDPMGIAVGEGGIWVVNHLDGTLAKINRAGTALAQPPIPVGSGPISVAVGEGTVWVGHRRTPDVIAIDAVSGKRVGAPIKVAPADADYSRDGVALALGTEALWAVTPNFNTLWRIDPTSKRVEKQIPMGERPVAVTAANGDVWVANAGDGTVTRIDESTGEVVGRPIPVGRGPAALAVGGGIVWVVNHDDATVTRINAETGQLLGGAITVGGQPAAVAVGGGAAWVTSSAGGTVVRIDLASGQVGESIPVGGKPLNIAAGDGAIWVANQRDGSVSRIGL